MHAWNLSVRNWEILGPPVALLDRGPHRKGQGRNPMTLDPRKSDGLVVPMKSPNKGAVRPAEAMEGRRPAKGNANEQTTLRTQSREGVPHALDRVRQAAKKDRNAKFTALFHHLTLVRLRSAFDSLERGAAAGVDGVTWQQYAEHVEENLEVLHARLHRGAYRAKPSRRVFIPKADGRQRPLGIATLEDKIVQRAVAEVLNAIYEVDFVGFSYGFRPGRNQHMGLDALAVGIFRKRVNWVLDADIRDFYGTIDHGWMMRFLEHRIADRRMLRLIQKWLVAGVLQEGTWSKTEGVPQGATISCLLANIYLHYVFDLWTRRWRQRNANGDMIVVRYADDTVVAFEKEQNARRYWKELAERLKQFGLELHSEKTRLLRFGKLAAWQWRRGEGGKPDTFTFLGFTHICGRSSTGNFLLMRHTVAARLRAKILQVKQELLRRRHQPVPDQVTWLASVMRGYFAYHAVYTNGRALETFRREVIRGWHRALRRRSQRSRITWSRVTEIARSSFPSTRVQHPWPSLRFDARTQGKSPVR
jgi:group II intron reverse transcriptase/maturase